VTTSEGEKFVYTPRTREDIKRVLRGYEMPETIRRARLGDKKAKQRLCELILADRSLAAEYWEEIYCNLIAPAKYAKRGAPPGPLEELKQVICARVRDREEWVRKRLGGRLPYGARPRIVNEMLDYSDNIDEFADVGTFDINEFRAEIIHMLERGQKRQRTRSARQP